MGYTHYYHTYNHKKSRITKANRERVMPILRDIVDRFGDILTGDGMGENDIPVIINNKEICLNGIGDNSHETFWFSMNSLPYEFTFCKTAKKPYDTPVSELLIVLKHHFPDLYVASDGFNYEDANPENRYVDNAWIVAARNVRENYGIDTELFEWEEPPIVTPASGFAPTFTSTTSARRNLIRPQGREATVTNNAKTNSGQKYLPGFF